MVTDYTRENDTYISDKTEIHLAYTQDTLCLVERLLLLRSTIFGTLFLLRCPCVEELVERKET